MATVWPFLRFADAASKETSEATHHTAPYSHLLSLSLSPKTGKEKPASWVLGFVLVGATNSGEVLGFWVVTLARAPGAQRGRAAAVLLGPVVLEHILGVNALLKGQAVLSASLGIGERGPVFGTPRVQIRAILVQNLDEFDPAVDGPEEGQVAGAVDVVGVGARAEQRRGALQATAVRRTHQGRVAFLATVGAAEDEVHVSALLDLFVDELDVVLYDGVQ
mmetsp:Transcript_5595/g.13585  ORF Transcript_5595/g.13585 Transcript_5595/m.13585 type:complete len:220 (+) Transcript_5595:164-823(+)